MGEAKRRRWPFILLDIVVGALLFCATAAVVWWQNTRLTVLYDLAGVLEPASRIAQGQIPYLDFAFPYAPLTFITQAEVIRLTGPVYWHHIVYCCIVAGLATVLTWRILTQLLAGMPHKRLLALLLTLPAVVLGIYCVFPHPFYDPDATFVVLLGLWLLLLLEGWNFPSVPTFLVGLLVVVPLFVKQNIGLAFASSIVIWLVLRIAFGIWKKWPLRANLLLAAGVLTGLGIAAIIIHGACGLANYKYWTWDFATSRRAPSMSDMLAVYADWWLLAWIALFLLGVLLFRKFAEGKPWETALAVMAMAIPFVWPLIYLAIDTDESERAERLIGLWPFVMIVLVLLAYIFTRRLQGVAAWLPFILVATAHGVFLSQQLWGSTYAIWPLLTIMIALVIRQLHDWEDCRSGVAVTILAIVISASICTAGGFYLYSEERLSYVEWSDGEMAHSTLPQLTAMSMRGDFLPQFDELIAWTDQNIPRDDGILLLPGEDLFFYTTQRAPHFPVELFDVTNNPYTPQQIRAGVAASDIEWLIVKQDLEIDADDMIDSKQAIFEELKPDFRHVDDLDNYAIWKRRHPGDPPNEEDDDSDDSDDDSGD